MLIITIYTANKYQIMFSYKNGIIQLWRSKQYACSFVFDILVVRAAVLRAAYVAIKRLKARAM